MVNRRTEPILSTGVILAGKFYGQVIPTVHQLDRDPLEIIETGDMVRVDGDMGEVIVKKKF
jgi:predicted aconitase with swiveling domain